MGKQLIDFTGLHILSGAEVWTGPDPATNGLQFVLDGVAYLATEDPDAGYRLGEIREVPLDQVQNRFKGVRVMGLLHQELLELVDVRTGKVVLEVGTEDESPHNYPCFVGRFIPEGMAINQGRG